MSATSDQKTTLQDVAPALLSTDWHKAPHAPAECFFESWKQMTIPGPKTVGLFRFGVSRLREPDSHSAKRFFAAHC
jgi:hypothetical protein